MPYERSLNEVKTIDQPGCVHLRSKAMYVTGDVDPTHLDELDSHHFYCWCNRTQHVVGPDEGHVDRRECIPGRSCYRATR
jgi:hypothetical protein